MLNPFAGLAIGRTLRGLRTGQPVRCRGDRASLQRGPSHLVGSKTRIAVLISLYIAVRTKSGSCERRSQTAMETHEADVRGGPGATRAWPFTRIPARWATAKRSPISQTIWTRQPSLLCPLRRGRSVRCPQFAARLAAHGRLRLMTRIGLTAAPGRSVRTVATPTIGRSQAPRCNRSPHRRPLRRVPTRRPPTKRLTPHCPRVLERMRPMT